MSEYKQLDLDLGPIGTDHGAKHYADKSNPIPIKSPTDQAQNDATVVAQRAAEQLVEDARIERMRPKYEGKVTPTAPASTTSYDADIWEPI